MGNQVEFSDFDNRAIEIIRNNVTSTILSAMHSEDELGNRILDIAPQDHAGAKSVFKFAIVETLDINPNSDADYIADLCNQSECSPTSQIFDAIICTEVLEHTLNPFKAVDEIYRMLKPGGAVYVTTPYNFRIHGPSPDCFRFTDKGLKSLFSKFSGIATKQIDTPDRPNMPICYTLVAIK